MKLTSMAAATAVAVAIMASGCRYNKANSGDAEANGPDTGTAPQAQTGNPQDLTAITDKDADLTGSTGGSLDTLTAAAAGKTFRERGYAPCTDVSFEPVYFGFDATAIAPAELAKVEAVAKHLSENPGRVVSIEGNCDERGSNEYNMSLGQDRAIVIGNFLAQNGISRDRIETISRGETNPAVEGKGESAWAKNRRGEFIILAR